MSLVNRYKSLDKEIVRIKQDNEARARYSIAVKSVESKYKSLAFELRERMFAEQKQFWTSTELLSSALCTRRCLAKGTMVATPTGAIPIEELRIGDTVYDENSKEIKVINVFNQGIQHTYSFKNNGREYFRATDNHVFLTQHIRSNNTIGRKLGDFYHGVKIIRAEYTAPMGTVHEPHAYALGAYIGDGCRISNPTSKQVLLSGNDENIISKVANQLNTTYKKINGNNYTWAVYNTPNHYEILRGKYAHEKSIPFEIIKTWDRESCLQFLAGLIDTNGSLTKQKCGIRLSISMQAKQVLEVAQWLFLSLFGVQFSLYTDRRQKYKNGYVYNLNLKHNYHVSRILEELSPFIVCERKKNLTKVGTCNNFNKRWIGGTVSSYGYEQTYDIEVDSDSHLFLLSNGLVSHNSGKSEGAKLEMVATALNITNANILYGTLTKDKAKSICWMPILKMLNELGLKRIDRGDLFTEDGDFKTDEVRMEVYFKNGSKIKLTGFDSTEREIDKVLGEPYDLVILDEVQSFKGNVGDLVYKRLLITVAERRGRIKMIGTPGDVRLGFFYDINCTPKPQKLKWGLYKWSWEDNVGVSTHESTKGMLMKDIFKQMLADIIAENPKFVETPEYYQEWKGEYFIDTDNLVYKFNPLENVYNHEPIITDCVLGIDLGWNDESAMIVWGWSDHDPNLYQLDEFYEAKVDLDKIAEKTLYFKSIYPILDVIIDSQNAQGIKTIENRYNIGYMAAEKMGKFEHIRLMNTDLRRGKIKFKEDCIWIQEASKLKKKTKAKEGENGKVMEDDKAPNHACFTPECLIETSKGIKQIKDVKVGDYVLGDNNKYNKVLHVLNREYTGELIGIRPSGSCSTIWSTPEHEFKTVDLIRNYSKGLTGQQYPTDERWMPVRDTEVAKPNAKSRTGFKNIKNEDNKYSINSSLAFLLGYYVAEGSLGGDGSQIMFAGHQDETTVIPILNKAFSQLGHRSNFKGIKQINSKKDKGRKLQAGNTKLYRYLKKLGTSTNKRLPYWVSKSSIETSLYILCGMIYGDGHISKNGIKYSTISEVLAYQYISLLSKHGIKASICYNLRENRYSGLGVSGKTKNNIYSISISKENSLKILDFIDKNLSYEFSTKVRHKITVINNSEIFNKYSIVKDIERKQYNGYVYTLEVENTHSYNINGVIVKNCDAALYGYLRARHYWYREVEEIIDKRSALQKQNDLDREKRFQKRGNNDIDYEDGYVFTSYEDY